MSSGLSLAMIVRDCEEELFRCLSTIPPRDRGGPDEVVILDTGSLDGTREVVKRFEGLPIVLHEMEWPGRFDVARNRSFELCKYDHVMWLDSDDEIVDPEVLFAEIREVLGRKVDVCLIEYDYEFSRAGHCTTRLRRERVVRRGMFSWKSPIHECLCSDFGFLSANIPRTKGYIRHNRVREDVERTKQSLQRNMEIFEKMLKEGSMETRSWYYFGNTLVGLGRLQESIGAYEKYCEGSDVKNEVYSARLSQSEACRGILKIPEAKDYAFKAVSIYPSFPSAYLQLAECSLAEMDWDSAIFYSEQCLRMAPNARFEAVWNPLSVEGRPRFIRAYALANKQDFSKALKEAEKASEYFPDDERVKELLGKINDISDRHNLVTAWSMLHAHLRSLYDVERSMGSLNGADAKLSALYAAVPDQIRSDPGVSRLLPIVRVEDKRTIGIYCGQTAEPFGPDSCEKGIGGSEEAVINMSRCLSDLGWAVEVYAYSEFEGVYKDGVRWLPFWSWKGEADESLDVAVYWRGANYPMANGMSSRATYLWLHDMPTPGTWAPWFSDIYNKVMFLSRYHREQYSWVPDEKVMMTSNGLDPDLFSHQVSRNPNKFIYASCPSRGLQTILNWWSQIRQVVPDAELDIYYGWNVLAKHRVTQDRYFSALYRDIEDKKNQPGVTWKGRVGQRELATAFAESSYWLYPTYFPEISCITAMRAQSEGCWPVCTDGYALSETVFSGLKVKADMTKLEGQAEWFQRLRDLIQSGGPSSEARLEMQRDARERFPWRKVAEQWDREFKEALSCSRERRIIKRGTSQVLSSAT